MSKVIAAINTTLDGFCDHTSGIADEELHQHYTDLLRSGGAILYGRITYELMEYWPTILQNPTGEKAMDEFAAVMDKIPKVVFSHTLKKVEWASARLATKSIIEELAALKQSAGGKDILVGSRSLIVSLLNSNLIDELQLCIQPVIAGKGLPLFNNILERMEFALSKTKTLNSSGSMVFYYKPAKNKANN